MNKGLEALEELKNDLTPMNFSRIEKLDRYKVIEKELKAWQAVKKQLIRCPMVGGFDIFILNGDAIYPKDDCYELLEELIA